MSRRLLTSLWFLVALPAVAMLAPLASAAAETDENWTVPRTVDGHPDLQGVWANNNATPLQRPRAWEGKERLTDAELAELEAAAAAASNAGADALFGDQLVLAAIARTEAESYDPTTGNYNQFWVAEREFSHRTSLVVDPPHGRIPPLVPAALERICRQLEYVRQHPADSWENRPLSERCITYGVPFVGAGYNSYFQIFQSADHVVIVMEMIHDARIIPLDGRPHLPSSLRQWHGDPRGRWEGETLVVETTNFSLKSSFRGSSENLHVVERFTRVGRDVLSWEVTIEDPTTWSRPWTASIPLKRSDEAIYEYACHEGNYGMEGILAGYRAQEAAGVTPEPEPLDLGYEGLDCSAVAGDSGY